MHSPFYGSVALTFFEELESKGISGSIIEKRIKVRSTESILLNLMAVIDNQILIEVKRKNASHTYYFTLIYAIGTEINALPSFKVIGPILKAFQK